MLLTLLSICETFTKALKIQPCCRTLIHHQPMARAKHPISGVHIFTLFLPQVKNYRSMISFLSFTSIPQSSDGSDPSYFRNQQPLGLATFGGSLLSGNKTRLEIELARAFLPMVSMVYRTTTWVNQPIQRRSSSSLTQRWKAKLLRLSCMTHRCVLVCTPYRYLSVI